MKVSPNIVEEFDMYLRSGGGFHGGVPYGRAGLAGNRPLRGFATHRAANTPSYARPSCALALVGTRPHPSATSDTAKLFSASFRRDGRGFDIICTFFGKPRSKT